MLLDASETTLGIFGFDRTLYGKPKDKKWWMEMRRNRMNDVQGRGWCKMIQSTKQSSHQTSEIVAYHKVKRKFLSLTDIEKEDPDRIQICEFRGQDFELIED